MIGSIFFFLQLARIPSSCSQTPSLYSNLNPTMDSPHELAGVDEEQETESPRRPSFNPLILVSDSTKIRANLVERNTRATMAPVPRSSIPARAHARCPAAGGLGTAPVPYAATAYFPLHHSLGAILLPWAILTVYFPPARNSTTFFLLAHRNGIR
jgi:hypothetical protein